MAANTTERANGRRVLSSDLRPTMAKASLPDVRKADDDIWRKRIGEAIDAVRGARSLKEFADLIQRDERQVARWIAGTDRPQLDAIFAAPSLRGPLVLALAQLADDILVETTIRIRRTA